ncbi:hypothetical protein KAI46_02360 [bacterium]|nr:hypothetical protein [bacterium]
MYHRESYLKLLAPWLKQKKPSYFASGDIWAALSLNLKGAIGLLAEPLLGYRQHQEQESRNVDQASPVINAIEMFLQDNADDESLTPLLHLLYAYLTRFKTQKSMFAVNNPDAFAKALKEVRDYWTKNVIPDKRAVDTVLPFEIANILSKTPRTIPDDRFTKLLQQEANSGARRNYRTWLHKTYNGSSLFQHSLITTGKIAIFGSMLNAHLLVLEALGIGIEVIACFDSSPARIGENVLGIPVISLEKISEYTDCVNTLILSNEHDQETAIKLIIKKHLDNQKQLQIISWKDLAK